VALGLVFLPIWLAFLCGITFFGVILSVPLVLLTCITAPAAIFVALRFWNAPRSMVPRGRLRLVLALVLSVAVLAGWAAGIIELSFLSARD
jgi:hypothetical protein